MVSNCRTARIWTLKISEKDKDYCKTIKRNMRPCKRLVPWDRYKVGLDKLHRPKIRTVCISEMFPLKT